jgi:single-stranded-DNA-specific exonuclease
LRALIAASGLEHRRITSGRVSFILAPRLNAVGRLGQALRGVDLLLTRDEGEANRLAREFEEINRTRQMVDREILDAARRMTDTLDLDSTYGVVLAAQGWHSGVIGIVASRLVEELCRPVILISLDGGVGKGSGRSIPVFDLHGGLLACRELLLRFGGHRAAAGLTIDPLRVPEFAERFNAVAAERLTPDDLVSEIRIDASVPLRDANEDLERLMRYFEPFGMGNPAPTLATRGVTIQGTPRVIGQTGLKFCFRQDEAQLEGIWWGAADRAGDIPSDSVVDIAYRLERDTYFETPRTVARLLDVRRSA